ncbi:GumC family protein [Marinitoga litoralis]|uniref:GumC family protein n=1 Tax=Marinitoga litoralis TaxID=570855 RepID=UPI001961E395|nr:Wzz/FepE/Etk N-terminal domain-containing protein [Marinitoga litoralis]MBM7560338.1 uncharacterized protein involved in exopolysaccharide biosynthesis [Marinitoga litoralis]
MIQKEIEISISDIFKALKRRKKIFWAMFFLVIILSIFSLFIIKQKYEAYSILEFSSSNNTQNILTKNILNISSDFDTEIEKLKLDKILLQVVRDLNMVEDANNNRNLYLKLIGKTLTERDMVDYLRQNINIQTYKSNDLAKTPNLIKLSFQSTSPTLAASIINLTYDYYLKFSKESFIKSRKKYIDNLNLLLKEAKTNLEKKSSELLSFQTKYLINENSFYNSYFEYYYSLDLKLLDINNQTETLKKKINVMEKTYFNLDKNLKIDIIAKTPELSNLKKQLITDKINYETMKLSSPNNPNLYELESKIKVEEETLNSRIKNLISDNKKFLINVDFNKYIEYISLKAQLENIDIDKNVLIEMKKKIEEIISEKVDLLSQYIKIKNEQNYWQKKYEQLMEVLEQEKIKIKIFEPKLEAVNPAFIPERPSFPSKKNTLLLGGIFGIFFGMLIALIRDFKDPSIKDLSVFSRIVKTPDYIINDQNEKNIIQKISSEIFSNNYKNIGFSSVGNIDFNITESVYNELFNFKIDIETISLKRKIEINSINSLKNSDKFRIFQLPRTEDGYFELFSEKMDILFLIIKEGKSDFEEFLRVYNNQKNIRIVYVQ